jgi:hypothetical protein
MKLDAKSGSDLRAFIKALFGLADPKPAPKDYTVVLTVHPPIRKA